MQTNETTIEILNDLVKINNDRIEGYQRAIKESNDLDVDLKAVFEGMISESETYKQELMSKGRELDGKELDDDSTTSGKIYRAWMDVKATFSGNTRKAILESCEFGEDAWRRAYESAINQTDIPAPIRELISRQYDHEQQSHQLIKKYRDAHNAID